MFIQKKVAASAKNYIRRPHLLSYIAYHVEPLYAKTVVTNSPLAPNNELMKIQNSVEKNVSIKLEVTILFAHHVGVNLRQIPAQQNFAHNAVHLPVQHVKKNLQ